MWQFVVIQKKPFASFAKFFAYFAVKLRRNNFNVLRTLIKRKKTFKGDIKNK